MRAASRARRASIALPKIAFGIDRLLLEQRAESVADELLDDRLGLAVAELDLGLALELRVRDLQREDRGQALRGSRRRSAESPSAFSSFSFFA